MASTALEPAPEGERQFPELTPMQEAFVHAFLADPSSQRAAAIAAGYAPVSAHVTASRLMQNDKVIEALDRASMAELKGMKTLAVRKLKTLIQGAKSEHVQLAASDSVLDRLGVVAPKQVAVLGQLSVSFDLT